MFVSLPIKADFSFKPKISYYKQTADFITNIICIHNYLVTYINQQRFGRCSASIDCVTVLVTWEKGPTILSDRYDDRW